MRLDLYTKIILTVIALCLIFLVMKDIHIIPEALAITDRGDTVAKVQIVSIDESPSLRWEAIPVEIQ